MTTPLNFATLSAATIGILATYDISDSASLTESYPALSESDVDVLIEETIMVTTDKKVWFVINSLVQANMYDPLINKFTVNWNRTVVEITNTEIDEYASIAILDDGKVHVYVKIDGEVYVDDDFASMQEYIFTIVGQISNDDDADLMGEYWGRNE